MESEPSRAGTATAADPIDALDPREWRARVFDRIHQVMAWICVVSIALMIWASAGHRAVLWLTVPMIAVSALYLARRRL